MLIKFASWMRQHHSRFGVWPERIEDLESRLYWLQIRFKQKVFGKSIYR